MKNNNTDASQKNYNTDLNQKDNHYNTDAGQKNNNDIEAIKKDIKDIMNRLSKFDKSMLKELYDNSGDLFSEFDEMKDKVMGSMGNKVTSIKDDLCSCIGKNPMTSAFCYMGLGAVLSLLLRK